MNANILESLNAVHNDDNLDVIMDRGTVEWYTQRVKDEYTLTKGMIVSHAMTITFVDKLLFEYTERFLMKGVSEVMKKTRGIGRYHFVKDVSSNGRFHLHGVVYFVKPEAITNLRRKCHKHFGMTKVKLMDSPQYWIDYMYKAYLPSRGTDNDNNEIVKLDPSKYLSITN